MPFNYKYLKQIILLTILKFSFIFSRLKLMPSFYLENLLKDWDEGLVRMVSPWDGLFNRCPLGLIQLGPPLNALILAWSQCYK